MTDVKIISENFLITRDIHLETFKPWWKKIFDKKKPLTIVTYCIHLSDKSVIQITKSIKGFPYLSDVESLKADTKKHAYMLLNDHITLSKDI